jgi:toxin YoeB
VKEGDPEPEQPGREPFYHPKFRNDLLHWHKTAPALAARTLRIVSETLESPFAGIGKPEPLRHDFQGRWSRRLTRRDRIIYKVFEDRVEFFSARNHYRP